MPPKVGLAITRCSDRLSRRERLLSGAAIIHARAADPQFKESMSAAPTYDRTPQVGIVRSDLKSGTEEDGTPFQGLAQRRPLNAILNFAQTVAMVHKAIEFGGLRHGGLHSIVQDDEWVVLLTGRDTDPRVTDAVLSYLKVKRRGARIT